MQLPEVAQRDGGGVAPRYARTRDDQLVGCFVYEMRSIKRVTSGPFWGMIAIYGVFVSNTLDVFGWWRMIRVE